MQFLVLGFDGDDSEAATRRQKVRKEHLALGDEMEAQGTRWYGASLRDEGDNMIGSFAVMDFPDRESLDAWLEVEPYVTGDVWRTVEVRKCSVRDPWKFNRPQEFFENRKRT